jgi:plasmid stabilization system protein ParE
VTWRIRYTEAARDDLKRLYAFLLPHDIGAAERALDAIEQGTRLLQLFPFTCRMAQPGNPFLRELLVSFGDAGYVMLYEVEDDRTITILAVRHQREDDYR